MALRWENPASTTHSLTPSPSNRPLIFWILTPRKKPEATGSAGRCEPGVGRFTDPHPLTCSNIILYFCWLMFGLCALPSTLSKPVLSAEEDSLFHRSQSRASMRCLCRPAWACFFLFLPDLCPSVLSLLPIGRRRDFLSSGFSIAPGLIHNRFARLQRGGEPAFMVLFPHPARKTAHRPAHGPFFF